LQKPKSAGPASVGGPKSISSSVPIIVQSAPPPEVASKDDILFFGIGAAVIAIVALTFQVLTMMDFKNFVEEFQTTKGPLAFAKEYPKSENTDGFHKAAVDSLKK